MNAEEDLKIIKKRWQNLKSIPKNFLRLFQFGKYKCLCCGHHLALSTICVHFDTFEEEFLENLFCGGKAKEVRLQRRNNERKIQNMIKFTDEMKTDLFED